MRDAWPDDRDFAPMAVLYVFGLALWIVLKCAELLVTGRPLEILWRRLPI